jgi:hypothetical protein
MHRPTLIGTIVAVAGMTLAATAAPTAQAGTDDATRRTVTPTVPGWAISDPGVIPAVNAGGVPFDVVLQTGAWSSDRTISTTTHPEQRSSWQHVTDRHLLNRLPARASGADAIWAPSGIGDATTQRYYTFYSAPVAGHTHDAQDPPRCIFSGVSRSNVLDPASIAPHQGLFRSYAQPLVCWRGSGTDPADQIGRPASNFSLIDPTPTMLDGQLFLTYKTQRKLADGTWVTSTRMVQLDLGDPGRKIVGDDHQLVSWRNISIEENPVMVEHGGKYVLFTSRGFYHANCHTTSHPYHSVYRVSGDKWSWSKKKVHTLSVPSGTCGTGNAQPVTTATGAGDRFFFNGRWPKPLGALHLYVGRMTWHGTTPSVTKLYR